MFYKYTGSDPKVIQSLDTGKILTPEEMLEHGDMVSRERVAKSVLTGIDLSSNDLDNPEIDSAIQSRALLNFQQNQRLELAAAIDTVPQEEIKRRILEGGYMSDPAAASMFKNSGGYLLATEGYEAVDKHQNAVMSARFLELKEHLEADIAAKKLGVGVASGWVDLLFGSLIDELPFIGGTSDRAEESKRLYDLAFNPNVPLEEAKKELTAIVDKAADAGFLADWNPIRADAMFQNLIEYGMGPEAFWDKFAQIATTTTVVAPLLGKLAMARTPIQQLSATAGTQAGAAATATALASGTSDDILKLGALNAVTPSAASFPEAGIHDMFKLQTSFGQDIARNISRDEDLLEIFESIPNARNLSPEMYEQQYGEILAASRRAYEHQDNIIDFGIVADKTDNLHSWAYYGKLGGEAFTTEESAQRRMQMMFKVTPAEAEGMNFKVFHSDRAGGWVIATTKNAKMKEFQKAFNSKDGINNVLGSWGRRWIFSSGSSLTKELQGLAVQGEMTYGRALKDLEKIVTKWKKEVPKAEQEAVDKIFLKLRDGDLKHYRRNLERDEFDRHYPGGTPTDRAWKYYRRMTELNDLSYYYTADGYFKDAVRQGFDEVFNYTTPAPRNATTGTTSRIVVKEVNSPDFKDGEEVWDAVNHAPVANTALPNNSKLFEVRGGFNVPNTENKVRYIVAPATSRTRRMTHHDILGYNPGGPRRTGKNNFVVAQINESNLSGTTKKFSSNPTVALATFTRGQAIKAMKSIKSIHKSILDELGGVSSLQGVTRGRVYQRIRRLNQASKDRINAAIRANNEWHVEIEDVDDYVDFLENEVSLDITKDIGVAAKNDRITTLDSSGNLGYTASGGKTFGDTLFERANAPWDGARRDTPIREYGGTRDQYTNPMDSILRNASYRLHGRAHQAYENRAVRAVLIKNKEFLDNFNDIAKMPARQALRVARIKSSEPEAYRVRDALEAVKRTLKIREDAQPSYYEHKVRRLEEWALEKTGKEIQLSSSNPLEALRKMAFHAKLGLFAMDQIVVQSSQVLQILALTANRPGTLLDLAGIMPIRAMSSGLISDATKTYMAKRSYKLLGFDSAEEMVEMANSLYKSGRLEIAHSIGELAEGAQYGPAMRTKTAKVMDASRIFFDEGEKIPRVYSAIAAWKEWKKLRPNIPHSDPRAQAWMADRQDKLTFQMSSVSASSWQRNAAAIPLQFMTYTGRVAESIFSDTFTKGERARILAGNLIMFGTGSYAMDYWLSDWSGGVELDPEVYNLVKYGTVDYLHSAIGLEDWNISKRLSPVVGITDLLNSWDQKSGFELIAGPSGQVVADGVNSFWSMAKSAVNGQYAIAEEDLTRFVRNISSANRAYQAFVIYNNAVYWDKKSREQAVVDDKTTGAIATLLGFNNREVLQGWDQVSQNKRLKEIAKEGADRLSTIFRKMSNAHKDGDTKLAEEYSRQAAFEMRALREANLDEQVLRDVERITGVFSEQVTLSAFRAGNLIGGSPIAEAMRGEE
jgi:hypothetical protein